MHFKNPIVQWTIAAAFVVAAASQAHAAIFTWTGGAGSGSNWYDTGNWDGGNVPVLNTNQLGTQDSSDVAIFDSEAAVGGHMPGGTLSPAAHWPSNSRMPNVTLRNGTLTIGQSINWGHNGNTFEIGDGDMGTLAEVNVNWSDLNRDPNGMKYYIVNADGTLNVTRSVSVWSNDGSAKRASFILNGGTAVISGTVNDKFIKINSNDNPVPNNYVSFDAPGSSFTADLGGQLPDESTITGAFGDSFRLGGALASDPNAQLTYTDNQDGSFTVAAVLIPEPASMALLGLGGLMLIARRR
jgi:hypothetical protein